MRFITIEVSSAMTKIDKCRHASPRLLDRLVMWLGFNRELHVWQLYRRQNGNILYYCRRCDCGADQVQNAGPSGDGKWRDVDSPFRQRWEREHFDAAEILDT
jgi:hypothetical protein